MSEDCASSFASGITAEEDVDEARNEPSYFARTTLLPHYKDIKTTLEQEYLARKAKLEQKYATTLSMMEREFVAIKAKMDLEHTLLLTQMRQAYMARLAKLEEEKQQLQCVEPKTPLALDPKTSISVLVTSPIRHTSTPITISDSTSDDFEDDDDDTSHDKIFNEIPSSVTGSFDFILDLWQTTMQENGGQYFCDNYETCESIRHTWHVALQRNGDYFSKNHLLKLIFEKRPIRRGRHAPRCKVCGLPIYKNRWAYHSEVTNYYADRACALWLVHEIVAT